MSASMEVARIEVIREITEAGEDLIWSTTRDADDNPLPLVEALGMLRMAEDTVIRESMGEIDGPPEFDEGDGDD